MARDNFVYFHDRKPPTPEVILTVIEDYLGPTVLKECYWEGNRYFITLTGEQSEPLQRVEGAHLKPGPEPGFEGRHMEVIWTDNTIDVLTRGQDDLTNDLAMGLAAIIKRRWKGTDA